VSQRLWRTSFPSNHLAMQTTRDDHTLTAMRAQSRVRATRSLALLLACALPVQSRSQANSGKRWVAHGSALADFRIAVDDSVSHSGQCSLRIVGDDEPNGFAGVSTALEAQAFIGHPIRVSAYVRTMALQAQGAALWARADGADGLSIPGAFVTTQGRQLITGTSDWTWISIDLVVPANAQTIVLGVFSTGEGSLWVDDVELEPIPNEHDSAGAMALGFEPPDFLVNPSGGSAGTAQTRSPREPPRELSPRGLANLTAFTRVAAYVRFFYPGDSVLTTNWDELVVRGMRDVEQAQTADSLARTLRNLIRPIAPDVHINPTGAPARAPEGTPPNARTLLFWQHCGYGVPATASTGATRTSLYNSERLALDFTGAPPASVEPYRCHGTRAAPVPDPAHPFVADLEGGITVSVPLALVTSEEARTATWQPRPATERFTTRDRATRLADVALLWMVPQHFYPYFDVVSTDWPAALQRALREAATASSDSAFDATLDRLIAALRDGHGNVVRSGRVWVFPDVRLGWVEHRVVVTAVGDSAAAAGVRRGDEVVSVDGRPVDVALDEAEERTSGATPQWIRQVALRKMLAGAPGTVVELGLRDPLVPNDSPRRVRLARISAVPPADSRPAKVAELRPGVWYVDLDRVSDADVAAALPQLAEASGIVVDMRGYPSDVNTVSLLDHFADSTIHSARFQRPLVVRPDHQQMLFAGEGWTIPPAAPQLHAKVAFLAGAGAISYAESTLGVVEENHLGAIVGETTAGTNGNINPFTLPGGYTVVWTGMRVQKRNGTPHHGVGIKPTVPVSPTLQGIRAGRDEVLERALQIVDAGAR
jgi:C-terminal processing protease CtpA/Prc